MRVCERNSTKMEDPQHNNCKATFQGSLISYCILITNIEVIRMSFIEKLQPFVFLVILIDQMEHIICLKRNFFFGQTL